MHTYMCVHTTVCVWRFEDNLGKSVLRIKRPSVTEMVKTLPTEASCQPSHVPLGKPVHRKR